MGKSIFMKLAVEMVHIQERIRRLEDDGGKGEMPIELVELRNEGVG